MDTMDKVLTAHDRCDRCGAQAYVFVDTLNGDLLFCGHHYRQHEPALAKVAISIIDERLDTTPAV